MLNEARMGHRLNLSWALPLVDEIAGSVHRHPLALLSVALVVQPGKASLLSPDVHVFWSLRAQWEIKPERLELGSCYCDDFIVGPEEASLWRHFDFNKVWMLESA